MTFVVHVEPVVHGMVLELGHVPRDVDDGHAASVGGASDIVGTSVPSRHGPWRPRTVRTGLGDVAGPCRSLDARGWPAGAPDPGAAPAGHGRRRPAQRLPGRSVG